MLYYLLPCDTGVLPFSVKTDDAAKIHNETDHKHK